MRVTARASTAKVDELVNRDVLVARLTSNDPVVRKNTREALAASRAGVFIEPLVAELADPRDHVRWEAAKALSSLANPLTAPALVNALEDDNQDVRWAAADGLIELGKTGLLTVLSALLKRASSPALRQSAAHVVRHGALHGNNKVLAPVLTALADWEPAVSVPIAAYYALLALKSVTRKPTDPVHNSSNSP